MKYKAVCLALCIQPLHSAIASPFYSELNVYGVTGLLTIPTAYTLPYGTLQVGYNTFLYPDFFNRHDVVEGHNYQIGIGVFKNIEIVGRLAEVHNKNNDWHKPYDFLSRDLIGNIKLQLPLPKTYPQVALGLMDAGGLAVNIQRFYISSSYQTGPYGLTLGYAKIKNQGFKKLLSGTFVGIDINLYNIAQVMIENDGIATRAGTRFVWSNILNSGINASASAILRSSNPDEQSQISFNVSFPLSGKPVIISEQRLNATTTLPQHFSNSTSTVKANALPVNQDKFPANNTLANFNNSQYFSAKTSNNPTIATQKQLEFDYIQLLQALDNAGMEYIKLGSVNDSLVVQHQNVAYSKSGLDALAKVLLIIAKTDNIAQFTNIQLLTTKLQMPLLLTKINTNWLLKKSSNFNLPSSTQFYSQFLDSDSLSELEQVTWHQQNGRKNWLDIELSPKYKAFYGTEIGVWDYDFALTTKLKLPLWPGALVSFSYDKPIIRSYHFQNKVNRYFSGQRIQPKWRESILQQTFNLNENFINTTTIGEFYVMNRPYNGIYNTLGFYALNGRLQTKLKMGKLIGKSDPNFFHKTWPDRTFSIINAEYFWPEQRLGFELEGGNYYSQDTTQKLRIKSYLGQSIITLQYKHSEQWKSVGLSLTMPFSFAKKTIIGPISIGGTRAWTTGITTTLDNNLMPSANLIAQNYTGILPSSSITQQKDLLENNLLTPAYINTHIIQILNKIYP